MVDKILWVKFGWSTTIAAEPSMEISATSRVRATSDTKRTISNLHQTAPITATFRPNLRFTHQAILIKSAGQSFVWPRTPSARVSISSAGMKTQPCLAAGAMYRNLALNCGFRTPTRKPGHIA